MRITQSRPFRRLMRFMMILGPGLITASADNDAPGIATYSMAGSTFGYSFLWIVVWLTLGEVVVQEMAARMGTVTGKGLTDLIRERYGLRLTFFVMLALAVANLGTTAAQFAGVASSAELFGVSRYLAVPIAAAAVWLLVTRGSYSRVERVLLVLSLYAVAYVISAFMVKPDWGEIARAALIPQVRLDRTYILAMMASVGTTITPWAAVYMQASVADKGVGMQDYAHTRADVMFGAAAGNVVSAFIIICTAATLYVSGIAVGSAEEAALALAPVAGPWAEVLFGAGLLGASLLAASVLPLATTYAVCEVFGWERGLDHDPHDAPIFYGIYTAMIVLSVLIVLIPGIPLFPLMWLSQVANAVLLPIVLVLMLRLVNDPRLMRGHTNPRRLNVIVIALGVVILIATGLMFVPGAPAP
ncbi:MAG: Nramp family divalent metal transporter [Chloroflexi bacterium]|nr:Nramp family divalent metal transporter [Chloroflexota bacterium]